MSDSTEISRFATCLDCAASVEVVDGRLGLHEHRGERCFGSRSSEQLGHAEGRLVSTILEAFAQRHDLDWVISYEDAAGEPKAFRLVRASERLIEPAQVIGETEIEARMCISLAAAQRKHKRA